MSIDKQALKTTLLSLEHTVIADAEKAYQDYLGGVRFDRDQTVELDDVAQAATQQNLAQETEGRLHEHLDHVEQIEAITFGPKSTVEPGAVVKLSGTDRHLVVAVPTVAFTCEGLPYLGISTEAPLYQAMKGLEEGDDFEFDGTERTIELVV